MKHLLTLSSQDFRSTFRDPIFRGLLFFPLFAFALIKWLLPVLAERYPEMIPYTPVILMWACMQSATMFGFIYGFLFLEEKETQVNQALKIIPLSAFGLVSSRLLLGLLVSTLVNLMLIAVGGVVSIPFWQALLIALQFSLMAPLLALLLGTFSKNRIEGLAQMKIFNISLILPGLIYFFDAPVAHATAVVPTYWAFRSIEASMLNGDFWLFWGVGMLYYGGLIFLLSRLYQKRMLG